LAVPGGNVEHEPAGRPLAGVGRDRLKVGIERGRAGDRVPVVVVPPTIA
jgi:hypothetical protein